MARRNDHSREQIHQMAVDAASQIVRVEGVHGLSARKVARAIGYTAGTLYLVFTNLDELILHVNARTLDELHEKIVDSLSGADSANEAIKRMSMSYYEFAATQQPRWTMLFTHQLPDREPLPKWFNEKISRLFSLVEQPLKQLQPGLETSEYQNAVRVLWSGVHGICELALSDKLGFGSEFRVEQLIESLVDNYLAGLTQSGRSM